MWVKETAAKLKTIPARIASKPQLLLAELDGGSGSFRHLHSGHDLRRGVGVKQQKKCCTRLPPP